MVHHDEPRYCAELCMEDNGERVCMVLLITLCCSNSETRWAKEPLGRCTVSDATCSKCKSEWFVDYCNRSAQLDNRGDGRCETDSTE
jgi:hypothetical protein